MPKKTSQDIKWEIESAADTLMRAEEIKQNKSLYGGAKKVLTRRATALNKVIKGGKNGLKR